MKIERCDICGHEEPLTDKSKLFTKDICKTCLTPKARLTIESPKKVLNGNPSTEFTRKHCMSSSEGLTITDIDGVFRNYKTQEIALFEYKSGDQRYLGSFSQWSIYKTLTGALYSRLGDYCKGTYVIWSDEYRLDNAKKFKINDQNASLEEVVNLMNLKKSGFEPIDFSKEDEYRVKAGW